MCTHNCNIDHVVDMCTYLCCTISCKGLQDMMPGCSAGSAGLSVCIGSHFPLEIYNPHSSCFILAFFISSKLYDSLLKGCCTFQLLRLVEEYVVSCAFLNIFSHNRLYCKMSSISSLAPPYNDTSALSPAILMSCFTCPT